MVAIPGETSQSKRAPKARSKGRAGHNAFCHLLLHGGGHLGTAAEEGGCPSQSPSSRAFSMSLQSVIWCGGQKGSYQRQPEI